ncbi:MAG: hypothetical protein KDE58_33630, partial [Caldilineaceae bacterium]|nr:hypothetical protein [Caldilineaceae bacterium]
DRLKDDMEPACAKACPTKSIHFGELDDLREMAKGRVAELQEAGIEEAYLYGADAAEQPGTEGLNAFFLLVDKPEVYNLPPEPVAPRKRVKQSWLALAVAGVAMTIVAVGAVLSGVQQS